MLIPLVIGLRFDTVLNNQFNTIASLKLMLECGKSRADFVVVENLAWGQKSLDFHRLENSETRKEFLDSNGMEIEMPLLESIRVDAMHEFYLSFFDVEKIEFGDVLLASSFLERAHPQLFKAKEYLGLEFATAIPPGLFKEWQQL